MSEQSSQNHPVIDLFNALDSVFIEYPAGVIAVPEQIIATSFFPGGTGLWCEDSNIIPPLPIGGIMVLGHDFHSEVGYKSSLQNKGENLNTPTWRNLIALFKEDGVKIDMKQCFFTNVYMGLRQGAKTTGNFPGAKDSDFVGRCQEFFIQQLQSQEPRLIITLGTYVPKFLSRLSPNLTSWKKSGGFKRIDEEKTALITDVKFDNVDIKCTIVAILHPSFRLSNVRHRKWEDLEGHQAEIAMLSKAKSMADSISQ